MTHGQEILAQLLSSCLVTRAARTKLKVKEKPTYLNIEMEDEKLIKDLAK